MEIIISRYCSIKYTYSLPYSCRIFPIRCQYSSTFTPAVSFSICFFLIIFSLFFCQGFSGFCALLFRISFLLSRLSVSRVTFSQFGASYFTRIISTNCYNPNFPLDCFSASAFPISLRTRVVFFPIRCHLLYFTLVMYTDCQIPNFLLACFSASFFPIFTIPFLCLRISVPSLIARHSLKNVVLPEFLFSFYLPRLLFLFLLFILLDVPYHQSPFPGGMFFSCLFLGLWLATLALSSRWDSVPLDWSPKSPALPFLTLPIFCQFPLFFRYFLEATFNFYFSKFTFSRSLHKHV